jgi:amino acid permease
MLGMSERGMLPELFAIRSKHGTPTVAILFSASGVLLLSWMNFSQVGSTPIPCLALWNRSD